MNSAEIILAGESFTTEFKRDLNDADLARASACLANGDGGTLFLGVEDDGTIVGARPRHGATTNPDRVGAVIQNLTDPPLAVRVSVDSVQGQNIIRIDVPRADPGPVGTKNGLFTKRAITTTGDPECVPMTANEIVSMGMLTRNQDYAGATAAGASMRNLNPDEFDRFRRLCRTSGDDVGNLSDNDILKALGLVPANAPLSLGAVLLFGNIEAVQRWIPNAEVLFQDTRTDATRINERVVGPLLAVIEKLWKALDQRQHVTELEVGLHRIEVPTIPVTTRREAIVNALVHRDYAALGPTHIQITTSEFTVTNPGGFPLGVTTTNILDQSRPRSPMLAAALKRAGLVDRRGKGVNDMFEQQLRVGRDAPDYSKSSTDTVVLTVPLGTADLDLVRFLLSWEDQHQQVLSLDELRIVHEVKAFGSASSPELGRSLAMTSSAVRTVTTGLVEAGIIEARGSGRSRNFHLTPRFYDSAKDRNAYVRVKGVDPLQQERMILDYVSAYGSISRAQAAALCQIAPQQARVTLKRMVDAGVLTLTGSRRGAKYIAP